MLPYAFSAMAMKSVGEAALIWSKKLEDKLKKTQELLLVKLFQIIKNVLLFLPPLH